MLSQQSISLLELCDLHFSAFTFFSSRTPSAVNIHNSLGHQLLC
uniref:Uncharacterized protein n=1 Tax=Rhizophora mucronata TaxID=61149 RepID=A0A2P2QU49_RHIMU